jgi:CTP:molybdopterin cytidylyltransferase MocA
MTDIFYDSLFRLLNPAALLCDNFRQHQSYERTMIDAIVAVLLARGDSAGFPHAREIRYKALLPVDGHPLAEYTLNALRNSDVEKIFIVQSPHEGLEGVVAGSHKYVFVNCTDGFNSMAESLRCGLEAVIDYFGIGELSQKSIITVPCDIPLVSAPDFNELIRRYHHQHCDVCFTAIRHNLLERSFPKRTFRSMYVRDFNAVYSMQNICFASGRILGFNQAGDGRRHLTAFDRDRQPIEGIDRLMDNLRKHRRGLLMLPLFLHDMFLKRLAEKRFLRVGLAVVYEALRRQLTICKVKQALETALNLEVGWIESESTAFSADVDCMDDLNAILSLKPFLGVSLAANNQVGLNESEFSLI